MRLVEVVHCPATNICSCSSVTEAREEERPLLDPAAAAAYIRAEYGYVVSVETLRRWVRTGRLRAVRSASGGILIEASAIDAIHRTEGPAAWSTHDEDAHGTTMILV